MDETIFATITTMDYSNCIESLYDSCLTQANKLAYTHSNYNVVLCIDGNDYSGSRHMDVVQL